MNIEHRLHPSSILFIIIELIKQFIFPLLFAFVASRRSSYDSIAIYFSVPAILVSLAQYWVYRYSMNDNEIVVREGLIFKNVRHVPYDRIQNLNVIRNPFHRLFGVAQVELESASGGKPEAVMRVISMQRLEELQTIVHERKTAAQPIAKQFAETDAEVEQAPSKTLHTISLAELVKAGIISNKGMLVVAALFGVLSQTGAIEQYFEAWGKQLTEWTGSAALPADSPMVVALLAVVGLVLFFIAIRVLSIIYMVVVYYNFELIATEKQLVGEYGLLTHIRASLPKARVQLITVTQNLLHRYFDRAAIRVESAGGAQAEQVSKTQLNWLAPIIDNQQVESLIEQALHGVNHHIDQWHSVEFRGWRRLSLLWCLLIIVVSAATSFFSWYFLNLLWLCAWVVFASRKYVRSIKYGINDDVIVVESGWLVKNRSIAPLVKIQSVNLSESPFDRFAEMSRIVADVAGVNEIHHHIKIPFLNRTAAREIFSKLYIEVSRTDYLWR